MVHDSCPDGPIQVALLPPMRRRVGIGLVVAAYALLLYTSLAAPAYARAHPHMDKAMLAEYAAPWPVALALAVSVVGILLALIPIRRPASSWISSRRDGRFDFMARSLPLPVRWLGSQVQQLRLLLGCQFILNPHE